MADAPHDDGEGRPDLETQRLVRAAKAGDVERFSELYERLAPALLAWAHLRIRPALRGRIEPEDVVAEVWVRAWRAFPQFDESAGFRPWVFRIAKNVLLECFRQLQRSPAAYADAGPSTRLFELQNLPESATNISRRVARAENVGLLLEWVRALDEEQQQLFLHCGLEGLSYAEAAERMALQRDTVAKRWQGLRERLVQFGTTHGLAVVD